MKKIIPILFFILTISFGALAKEDKSQKREVTKSSLVINEKNIKLAGECSSGLITEGNTIIGYWIMCDGILFLRFHNTV